jgi:phosphoserine phosphatase
MTEIYLIRHGETEFNRRNIVQGGGIDSDLNDTGIAQGAAFFDLYGHLEFDSIYCTSLKRTRQTLQGFERKGHSIQTLPELNEFGWGILEGAEGTDEVAAQFQRVLAAWRSGDFTARVEKGESPIEAWERAQPGVERVMAENTGHRRVLICSHGRIMRVILSQMLGYGLHRMDLFPHHNTALNLLSFNSSGKFRIHKLNDTTHLQ